MKIIHLSCSMFMKMKLGNPPKARSNYSLAMSMGSWWLRMGIGVSVSRKSAHLMIFENSEVKSLCLYSYTTNFSVYHEV